MRKKWCWKAGVGDEEEENWSREKKATLVVGTGKKAVYLFPTESNDLSSWAKALILFPWTHLIPVCPGPGIPL